MGQTAVVFPQQSSTVVYLGDVVWGQLDPTPIAQGDKAQSVIATWLRPNPKAAGNNANRSGN